MVPTRRVEGQERKSPRFNVKACSEELLKARDNYRSSADISFPCKKTACLWLPQSCESYYVILQMVFLIFEGQI